MAARWRRLLAATLLAAARGAGASAMDTPAAVVEVVSPRPDSVSVTIYRDLFALITETRTLELPAEPVTLAFDGVVETLIPASAVVSDLGRGLEERNYDYEELGPASLLRKSIGKTVTLTRTRPGSGKVTQTRAVIEAANRAGVTLRTTDGLEALNCSGLPEGLAFEEIPADLNPHPRLSIRLAAGVPGKRTVKLSYVAQGFAWSSDYVAHLDPLHDRFDLTGWVTLKNLTQASLKQAEVQVVAGRLNLLDADDGGSSLLGDTAGYEDEEQLQEARSSALAQLQDEVDAHGDELAMLQGCYPIGLPVRPTFRGNAGNQRLAIAYAEDVGGGEDLEEVVVTGLRGSLRAPEALADYHLYRVPWPTDINGRQTKQAVFLQKAGIEARYFYTLRLSEESFDDSREDEAALFVPKLTLGFLNRRAQGLGEPLPGGMLRAFLRDGADELFAGEAQLGDKAVGTPVELTLGGAIDLAAALTMAEIEGDDDAQAVEVAVTFRNAKSRPVALELRQSFPEDVQLEVSRASHPVERKYGDYAWHLRVGANSETTLRYRLTAREMRTDD